MNFFVKLDKSDELLHAVTGHVIAPTVNSQMFMNGYYLGPELCFTT